jgi:hypothetical protein
MVGENQIQSLMFQTIIMLFKIVSVIQFFQQHPYNSMGHPFVPYYSIALLYLSYQYPSYQQQIYKHT